jgi:hypothetical protein
VSRPFWEQDRILTVRSGSRAYGTHVPESDEDLRAVCIPTLELLLGLDRFEQHTHSERDEVTYALAKFGHLCLDGALNTVELLFIEGEHLLQVTPEGERLRAVRDHFLTRHLLTRALGYAHGQLKRLEHHRRWWTDEPPCPDPADYGATHEGTQGEPRWPDPQRRRDYDEALKSRRSFEEWRRRRNPTRAALEQAHGYDTKSGLHVCRILGMCDELLSEGVLNVVRPDADWLRSIRTGALSHEALREWVDPRLAALPGRIAASEFPARAERGPIVELVVDIQRSYRLKAQA